MNKNQFEMLHKDIINTLKTLEKKYNVKFSQAGGTISGNDATLKILVTDTSDAALKEKEEAERKDFEIWAENFGFKKTDYLRKIKIQGNIYTLTALNVNRPKNCCTIIREDGKEFKCPKETALNNWLE